MHVVPSLPLLKSPKSDNDLIFFLCALCKLGFDRLMAILCRAQSIRDVIAFPKTSVGTDLLFKSPATISEEALYQYGLRSRRELKK